MMYLNPYGELEYHTHTVHAQRIFLHGDWVFEVHLGDISMSGDVGVQKILVNMQVKNVNPLACDVKKTQLSSQVQTKKINLPSKYTLIE